MQQSNRFWAGMRRAYQRYDRLMEKQGFTIVLVVCVLVIALSALYTFHFREVWDAEDSGVPSGEHVAAGGTQNAQSLREAQELIQSQNSVSFTAPTEAPFRFSQPVSGFLDRDFSMTEPQYYPQANYWRVHPGIDLQVEYGATVSACADGAVVAVGQDNEKGLCIRLKHSHGYETIYAGLSDASYVKAGDPVQAGQTIGHAGNGVLAESDALPHLHLEVWLNGTPVDPVELFLGVDIDNTK